MCFLEYIGYTCGHISLPVLRPCPLTTVSHTFPTCPRRGDKPFLAGEMCPTCQKIVHSRATQIEEYEHRFMHERGVCGCETIFPYLIRPRVIGGGELTSSGVGSGNGSSDEAVAVASDASPASDNIGLDKASVPPILREAVDAGGRSVVSVRLPSLYAAEWVADHRERHNAGRCDCRVDCQTYNEATQDDGNGTADDTKDKKDTKETNKSSESIYLAPPTVPAHRRVASLSSVPSTQPNDVAEFRSALCYHQRRKSHGPFSCSPGVVDDWAELRATGTITHPAHVDPEQEVATDAAVTGYEAQAAHRGKPVRYSGAVFTKVPAYLPLTGPFLARPTRFSRDNESHTPVIDGVLDKEILEKDSEKGTNISSRMQKHVAQAMERNPLLGYPIGAGPEGVPHAAPWEGRPSCWR